ncbi:hypothetical protein CS0771_09840 [Catellatospora sp. IY07-71]|uniref:hypothetical protein n=1 Tax=Catellatospora sp. IY07-71 TaxID=2728827 RepID=UPI001BB3A90A|nr:hypothetical protein [Catellatospora sp. IY07-71]BCJ71440.1 hypothetical protein CS0771_09840 [Catellatospora sp. IY07-71]
MSHRDQKQVVNLLSNLEQAVPAVHPTWCELAHPDHWPVHSAHVGEISYGPTLTLTVEIVDVGLGSGPRIAVEVTDSQDSGSGDVYELPAQAARDLSMLLAAGADILSGCTGQPLKLGAPQ